MLDENLIKQISEEFLQIVDKYELSIFEYKEIFNNTIDIMENIAIIPKKRRYSRNNRNEIN